MGLQKASQLLVDFNPSVIVLRMETLGGNNSMEY
jgi:hypothetical protein